MITKAKFIDDVFLQLLQGSPSDDENGLEKTQIAQWGTYHLNDLVRQEVIAELSKGNQVPPVYIVRDEARELSEEDVDGIDDLQQRMWVELTREVLDLPRDAGIVAVWDYDLNLIHKASIDRLHMLNLLRFAKPSPENALYYRVGKKIFVEGFRTADIDFNEIIVDYVPKQDIMALDDDDEILISDALIPMLVALTVQTGKQQLLGGTVADQENDGITKIVPAYHQQIGNPSKQQQVDE